MGQDETTEPIADRVIDRVTDDCRNDESTDDKLQFQHPERTERSDGKKQRITRQERRYDEPCLGEDDDEQDDIRPTAAPCNDIGDVAIEMQQNVEGSSEKTHR
jgi:hypothetical protein